ncbi:MAG: SMI1/KNR4 family protein [Ktedonobacterales bacterium]
MGRYLERYLAGECQPVWDELLAQGAAIREEPLASEGFAVARETMRRVRHNIEPLILRLGMLGYRFGEIPHIPNWNSEPWEREFVQAYPVFQPPPPDTARTLDELEQQVGVLPLSIRAFYLEIGGVNFIGSHATLDPNLLGYDPLFMYPLADVYDSAQEDLGFEAGENTHLIFSPDGVIKYDQSGGDPYFMLVPNTSVDGVFQDGYHDVTFVEYLRICFRSGGLTDLERSQQVKGVADALAYLRQDLLPI